MRWEKDQSEPLFKSALFINRFAYGDFAASSCNSFQKPYITTSTLTFVNRFPDLLLNSECVFELQEHAACRSRPGLEVLHRILELFHRLPSESTVSRDTVLRWDSIPLVYLAFLQNYSSFDPNLSNYLNEIPVKMLHVVHLRKVHKIQVLTLIQCDRGRPNCIACMFSML